MSGNTEVVYFTLFKHNGYDLHCVVALIYNAFLRGGIRDKVLRVNIYPKCFEPLDPKYYLQFLTHQFIFTVTRN